MLQRILAITSTLVASAVLAGDPRDGAIPEWTGEVVSTFGSDAARQGVGVDADFVYVADNFRVWKHEKATGRKVDEWVGDDEGQPLTHLDSAVVDEGLVYAAHSNYPIWPMTSSVEIWDSRDLEHTGTHSFGIALGSFTWLDRHAGAWWGAFGNYDRVQIGMKAPYGETRRTQIVRMSDDFQVEEAWVLPDGILDRLRPMSNSGGSWGPDGFLYLTGHDRGEIYVTCIPAAGSTLVWLGTVLVTGLDGQGIAWDRSTSERLLWAIRKEDRQVLAIRMPVVEIGHERARDCRKLN